MSRHFAAVIPVFQVCHPLASPLPPNHRMQRTRVGRIRHSLIFDLFLYFIGFVSDHG
jgi:hypothetical protein